jgi:hypothetical protein
MRQQRPFPALYPSVPYGSTRLGTLGRWVALFGALGFAVAVLPRSADPTVIVGGVLVFTFLAAAPTGRAGSLAPLDLLMAGLTVGALAYRPDAVVRLAAGGAPSWTDFLAAVAFLAAIAEAGRRAAGWPALVGIVAWTAALLLRDRLPEALRGTPVDPVALGVSLFYAADGLLATPLALIIEWLLPIVFFAGTLYGARLTPLLAGMLRPFGLAPAALALAGPFLVEPDVRAGSGAGPTLRALLPLTPPALGFAALIVGQALGNVGEAGWRLLAPAALALAIVVAGRRIKHWRRVWPSTLPARPALNRPTVGTAAVLAAPLLALLCLLVLPPAFSFGLGTGVALAGALAARPSWSTGGDLLRGLIWAGRQVPLAGAVVLLFAVVERLEAASGLLAALGETWYELEPLLTPLLFVLLSFAAGAVFFPPAAIGVVMLLSGNHVPDPAGAFIAALFWIGAATILAGQPKVRAFFGRLVWASPLLLVAFVATRATFEERGYAAPLILLAESAAALAVGVALTAAVPLGGLGRALLVLLGVLLLSRRADFAVLLVFAVVGAVMVASVTGRPSALNARRWRNHKFLSRLRPPRLPDRP